MPDQLPLDPSIVLPASIRKAAEAAVAAHKEAYGDQTPAIEPVQPIVPVVAPVQPVTPAAPEPVQPVTPAAPEPVQSVTPAAPEPVAGEDLSADQWKHRYLSMKGRFDQSQVTIGSMQEQMQELGDELMRTQHSIRQPQTQSRPQLQERPRRVTEDDVKTYGPELIDVVQRAALDAVAPELQTVQQQTRQVSQRVMQQSTAGLYSQLETAIPDWKSVNVNPRFKAWCRLPDVYSGEVRGRLLNVAFNAADAPRVIAFFKGFLAEEVATGNAPTLQPEPELTNPPRQAAVQLETLTAPGRAKPATGDTSPNAADKPVLTRAHIAKFYADVRKGAYVGHDAEKARDEATIFSAQREGRVR